MISLNRELKYYIQFFVVLFFIFVSSLSLFAQTFSTARVWNEVLLNAIRNDEARPTVHARNLHHTSIAMYDIFAAYDEVNETYFLGKTIGDYTCIFDGIPAPDNVKEAREIAISYAMYRLIRHRFEQAPGKDEIIFNTDLIFSAFGYDPDYEEVDYSSGNPAALGNYVANQLIIYGLQDGSNEANNYANAFYESINPQINPFTTFTDEMITDGNERLIDPNRWQQLNVPGLVDQAGNLIPGGTQPFLSPEWGNVIPFSLTDDIKSEYERDSNLYMVYHDPGPPHFLDTLEMTEDSKEYQWGFGMVAHWDTHTILDSFVYDISPASLGNIDELPNTPAEYREFYNFQDGGDASKGYDINPYTGQPYEPQIVQRGDYTKVIAEWWADGPESETPPGHWFTILNYVSDQPELIKRYKGTGPEMTDLEWDIKAYFALSGAMHDAAISAWSIKGYYDYIRPISAIRYMIDRGQSSDPNKPKYDIAGIPLVSGSIEQILDGDPALFPDNSNYGDIKILSNVFEDERFYFRGDFWLPYQPINFITPPFAGYVSGHSTFSRAAAEILTMFTGDDFFPGGLGTYFIEANNYLETTQGPTTDIILQWATYRDAANQSAISRIWGGIHPPIDDIPGRKIGIKIGKSAFDLSDSLFGEAVSTTHVNHLVDVEAATIYPNPVSNSGSVQLCIDSKRDIKLITILDAAGAYVKTIRFNFNSEAVNVDIDISNYNLRAGLYNVQVHFRNGQVATKKLIVLD